MRDSSLIAAMLLTSSTFLLPNKDKVADTLSLPFSCLFFFSFSLSHIWGHNILKYSSWCWCTSVNKDHGFYCGPCIFMQLILCRCWIRLGERVHVKQHREDIFVIPLRIGCVVRHDVKKQWIWMGVLRLTLALQGPAVYWTPVWM